MALAPGRSITEAAVAAAAEPGPEPGPGAGAGAGYGLGKADSFPPRRRPREIYPPPEIDEAMGRPLEGQVQTTAGKG